MRPPLGIGIGLRAPYAEALLEQRPAEVAWLEVHPENYLRRGGLYPGTLERCLDHWPVVTHGLTMGFGAATPYAPRSLAELRAFLDRVGAPWHSDHLCFAEADGVLPHELLPIPWTRASADAVCARVEAMQAAVARPVLVENITYYATFDESDRRETDFLRAVLDRTSARLLLDVNNVYVNAMNHGFDAERWLDEAPLDRVTQIHVAGHAVRADGIRIDTHAERVADPVLALLRRALRRVGPVAVLLERDDHFGSFDELMDEVRTLDALYREEVRA